MSHTHVLFQCRYCDRTISQCCPGELESYMVRPETCEICEKKLRMMLKQIPDKAVEEPEPRPSCCLMRRKVVVAPVQVLPEAACGVPDSEMADYLRHGESSPTGKPILEVKFCPWCGAPRDQNGETRITEAA